MKKDSRSYSILVIEDNPGDFVIVRELLREQMSDPKIVQAKNFQSASAMLMMGDAPFDVILLDLSLPDKSGRPLIADLLPMVSACPVIILSGFADLDFSVESITLGVTDYLLKDNLTSLVLYKSIVYAIERKRISTDLNESEKRYRSIFHHSPQPMCLYDSASFLITNLNKSAVEQYGYSFEEFLGMTLFDMVPEQQRPQVISYIKSQTRELNKTYKGAFSICKKSGELMNVETYSTPLIMGDSLLTLVIAIDVTEKTLYEHKVTKAIIKTQEDERYEIGGELHDNVCQILAGTLLKLGMLRKSVQENDRELVNETCEHIMLASEEIRNLSHRLAPAFFNDSKLEEAIEALLNTFNVENKYEVLLTIDPDLDKFNIELDLQLNLYRILQEQLKNFVKYAKASSITIGIYVAHSQLIMHTVDNGIGFDTSIHKHGIGIANMKRRAELFAGSFDISSSPGKGCSITVTVPVKDHQ